MAALVCYVCGGKLKIINNSTAVCESCGVQYDIAAIRQELNKVKGVVHVDTAHLTSNYYLIAKDAYESRNYAETEKYCNKIIENIPNDAEAYFLKGKAVAWQSSLKFFRFDEAIGCFINAVNCCLTDDIKSQMHTNVEEENKRVIASLFSTICNYLRINQSITALIEFKKVLDIIFSALIRYNRDTKMHIKRNYIFGDVSPLVRQCITEISQYILAEYKVYKSRVAYLEFHEKSKVCIEIIKTTVNLCDDDDEADSLLYELMISMLKNLINYNCKDLVPNKWGAFKEEFRLSSDELAEIESDINIYENKINNIIKKGEQEL